MHVCQIISTTAGDSQFSDTEISHQFALFLTKLSLIKTKTILYTPLKLIFLENSRHTSLLESLRRPLCHYIVKIIKVLKIFRMLWKLIYKLSITHYIAFDNFRAIRWIVLKIQDLEVLTSYNIPSLYSYKYMYLYGFIKHNLINPYEKTQVIEKH